MSGRPTICTPELIAAAWEYVNGGWKEVGDKVPMVAGLAAEIGVYRGSCCEWAKVDGSEFSNILDAIKQNQERALANGGLSGEFNAPITKMMLTKHGYSDSVTNDHKSSDGSMTPKDVSPAIILKARLDAITNRALGGDTEE